MGVEEINDHRIGAPFQLVELEKAKITLVERISALHELTHSLIDEGHPDDGGKMRTVKGVTKDDITLVASRVIGRENSTEVAGGYKGEVRIGYLTSGSTQVNIIAILNSSGNQNELQSWVEGTSVFGIKCSHINPFNINGFLIGLSEAEDTVDRLEKLRE